MSPNLTANEVAEHIQEYNKRWGSCLKIAIRNEDGTEWPIKHVTLEKDPEGDPVRLVLQ